jgi:hypothetical protein
MFVRGRCGRLTDEPSVLDGVRVQADWLLKAPCTQFFELVPIHDSTAGTICYRAAPHMEGWWSALDSGAACLLHHEFCGGGINVLSPEP